MTLSQTPTYINQSTIVLPSDISNGTTTFCSIYTLYNGITIMHVQKNIINKKLYHAYKIDQSQNKY